MTFWNDINKKVQNYRYKVKKDNKNNAYKPIFTPTQQFYPFKSLIKLPFLKV